MFLLSLFLSHVWRRCLEMRFVVKSIDRIEERVDHHLALRRETKEGSFQSAIYLLAFLQNNIFFDVFARAKTKEFVPGRRSKQRMAPRKVKANSCRSQSHCQDPKN